MRPSFSRLAGAFALACALSACLALPACAPAGGRGRSGASSSGSASAADEADYACSYFYFLWGRSAELRQDLDEALEAYEKTVICDPAAEYAERKIPVLLFRLERIDEAADWLRLYLARNPDNVHMRLLYAHILLGLRKNEAALAQYRRIMQSHPSDPAVTLPLAEMYLNGGYVAEARRILEQVLKRRPESYPAHILMARVLQGEGKVAEAMERYRRALDLNWSAEVQIEAAEVLAKAGEYDRAEAMYREIIEREDQSEAAQVGLIRLLMRQHKEDEALAELLVLRRAADRPLWVEMAIARLHIRHERFGEARSMLEQSLRRESSGEARLLLAVLLNREKKYEAALRQVRLIDRQDPEYPEALGLMVDLYRALNREDDAILFLERNIAGKLTRHPAMYPLLAALHDEQGRAVLARRVLEQGVERYPEDEDLLYVYGGFLENKSEHTRAMEIMERIAAMNPDNAAALNFLGYTWADEGVHLDKALEYLQRAARLRPDSAAVRDSLGWAFYRLGRMEEAVAELEKAAAAAENEPEIQAHLAEVYLKIGKKDEAAALCEKVRRLCADNGGSSCAAVQDRMRTLLPPGPEGPPVSDSERET